MGVPLGQCLPRCSENCVDLCCYYYFVLILPRLLLPTATHFLDYELLRPIWISSLPTSLTYYFVLILPCLLLLTTTHFLDYELPRPIWISSLPTTLTCVTMISVVNGSPSATITNTTTSPSRLPSRLQYPSSLSFLEPHLYQDHPRHHHQHHHHDHLRCQPTQPYPRS